MEAPLDISGYKHGPTQHYSTVSQNNPPIYPELEGSGSHWDLMKLGALANLAVN